MTIEVKVPGFPESVADGVIAQWHKRPGEAVKRDEVLVDIETDKVVFEVPAPADGTVEEILEQEGATVVSGQVLGRLTEGPVAQADTTAATPAAAEQAPSAEAPPMGPAARKLIEEHGLDAAAVAGSGKGGRVLKEDVQRHLERAPAPAAPVSDTTAESPAATGGRLEKRVPMTRLRKRVAERLVEAQHNAAILTTFNEVNMQPVMDLRTRHKERFEKEHGVRLGFMSFFAKAAVEALRRFPEINASVDGDDIVYHGFFDIGIAVGSPRGLVVPILRDCDRLSMAEIEDRIATFAEQAMGGRLAIEDITGGTFTITNGGVFGSLLSTPILNPPQSAILGMHTIQQRPVVEDGEIVIRPMMYLALSYDHRIVDGKEAVQFLIAIKDLIEDPARMLLGV